MKDWVKLLLIYVSRAVKFLLQPWNSQGINKLSGEVGDLTRGGSSGGFCACEEDGIIASVCSGMLFDASFRGSSLEPTTGTEIFSLIEQCDGKRLKLVLARSSSFVDDTILPQIQRS
jgi:hypothetical protein